MNANQLSPWDALGDPTRRAIFERLVEKAHAVGALAERFPISRPAVSQHLRVLAQAGLVTFRAEGTSRVYAVSAVGLAKLRADLDRFWDHALNAFKAAVEEPAPHPKHPKKKKKERS